MTGKGVSTMIIPFRNAATLAAAVTTLGSAAPAFAQAAPAGIWANPARSVHVAFSRCDGAICGRVVWASRQAQADAERGSDEPLVGSLLFDHFEPEERGRWSGEVLVPDIGQRVSGTITLVNARTMVGEGCLFAGFGCKSQTWTRIK